jgi:ribosomal-protein-alanine N-acetyltransferase
MAVAEKPVEIRSLRSTDIACVTQIENASYDFPWSAGIFLDCLAVGYLCQVLVLQGRTVAYSILSTGAGETHVLNLTVDKKLRRQGLGRFLLENVLAYSRDQSLSSVFLEVRPGNKAAIALYESEGFEPVGVRRGYYRSLDGREDALVYALDLNKDSEDATKPDPASLLV